MLLKILWFNIKNTPFRDFMRGFSAGWEWCKLYWSQPLYRKMVFPSAAEAWEVYKQNHFRGVPEGGYIVVGKKGRELALKLAKEVQKKRNRRAG